MQSWMTPTNQLEEPANLTFCPRPDKTSNEFDLPSEIERMPIKLSLGKKYKFSTCSGNPFHWHHLQEWICLLVVQWRPWLLWLDYPYDPTMRDTPVYLPCCTIPHQLQGEVSECLDTWLRQGIIRPSRIPYASHGVTVNRKIMENLSMHQL